MKHLIRHGLLSATLAIACIGEQATPPRGPRLQVGELGLIEVDLSLLVPPNPHSYDDWMIRYAYTPIDPDEEMQGLRRVVEEGLKEGLRFREYSPTIPGVGRIHFEDPLVVLEEDMRVRRVALERFGPEVLEADEPTSLLFERLIPVYFHHRPSLEAAARMLGGVDVTYDPEHGYRSLERVIDSQTQRHALDALLDALSPEELSVPPRVAAHIPPKVASSAISELEWPVRRPGVFRYMSNSGPLDLPLSSDGVFDPTEWAEVLSGLVVTELLNRERLARVAAHYSSGQSDISVHDVMDRIIGRTWGMSAPTDPGLVVLRRIVGNRVLDGLIALVEDDGVSVEVRAPIVSGLKSLIEDLRQTDARDADEQAHIDAAIRRIGSVVSGES